VTHAPRNHDSHAFQGHPPGGSPLDRRIADNLAARGIISSPQRSSSTRLISTDLATPDNQDHADQPQPTPCCTETPAERLAREQLEQARTARRVLVSFILFLLLVPVVLFVAVVSDIEIPMVAIFALFGLVLVGALMAGAGRPADRAPTPPQDEGRPIGCCSGPRPMRRFRQ